MCDHDWEKTGMTADKSGDLYISWICTICGETQDEVEETL